ncbi:MAG: cephalosporin hydroxylase family protein [Sedimentisphaerales bacterium]|nr:cephalosporin hydroxylase family protein [Sedimentisphaerales bacterium]
MDEIRKFRSECNNRISSYEKNSRLKDAAANFMVESTLPKYSYNFTWLGRPIIQYPQDIIAIQEIIWEIKPDLIIETGIAHGGSIIFYASMMELIGKGMVLGIDIDIREHNRKVIEEHPMFKRIEMIEGSSISDDVAEQVRTFAENKENVLVCLDSNHTHEHVLREMELYSPLVTKGSYLVVFDTIIEDLPNGMFPDRPWDKGNNPKTAVAEFLKTNKNFVVDTQMDNKLLITVAPGGYLRRIK